MFVHLNCHSNHSFLAGANRIEDLVHAAANMQCPSLALTDTDGLYDAVKFYRATQNAGIHPIFGVELTSGPRQKFSFALGLSKRNLKNAPEHAVLLAKNLAGFGEICRAITARQIDPQFSLSEQLATLSDHVIVLCHNLNLLDCIAKKRGCQNLYAELAYSPDRHVLKFARDKNLPVVATNRIFFCQPNDREIHLLLSAIRENTTINSLPPKEIVSPNGYMKSPEQMTHIFRHVPDAICNTLTIAEQCDVKLPVGTVNFPPFVSPGKETHSSYLRRLAHAGIVRLYPEPISQAVKQRLRYELKIINDLNFTTYFLIVWDIVREAQGRGIPSIGRGSAANSLVCRALNITEVDPIRHNLYFERFLNPERTDYPDIDIDFPWNRRDEIFDYVFKKYGHDQVALISSHIHFRSRSALREVGKALGVSEREINRFTALLPHSIKLSQLDEARQIIPECHNLPLEDDPYRTMVSLARRIEGFPRHVSIHCGGIIISPFPITDRIPLQKTQKGLVVTQYDMYPIEDMGFLKIDLLAQRGLAVLTDTVAAIETRKGTRIDFNRIDPTQDEKTRKLIWNGNTIGCFYIESPGMRNLLKKLGVCDFDMLTAASSIIRPGVADSGMMKTFIDRHNGKEPVTYLHPKMETTLKDTFGVMIYQEDVIKVAHIIARMSLNEADSLRKCMSKKRNRENINTYRQRFISGAIANKVKARTALEIWRQIESFAGYAFCKAHSASFAMVSYRAAYLKAHYPTEFMAAVLSNQGGFYDVGAYIEEARRMGARILPPHINHSYNEFTAHDTSIRIGLSQVKRLKKSTINSILKNRQNKLYTSLIHFLLRVNIDKAEAEALIRCGALDGFDSSRPEMLWVLKIFLKHGKTFFRLPTSPLKLGQYSPREKLLAELEHLDLTVSSHLLALYDLAGKNRVSANELSRVAGRVGTLVGCLVTAKQTLTVKNELMKFVTLDDATALFEVALFPKTYKRFGSLFYDHGPYIVKGRVEKEGRFLSVTALWVNRMEGQRKPH
jgi:DNA-directed DNA polymerase III PolC